MLYGVGFLEGITKTDKPIPRGTNTGGSSSMAYRILQKFHTNVHYINI